MRDRGLIVAGLMLFLALVLSPIWYNLAAGKTAQGPALKLPAQEKECVAPISYMKTSHMKLLYEWRDRAVRNNDWTYAAYNGKTYAISLTGTCLRECHTDRSEFCDRCHAYSGIKQLFCWNCHLDPSLTHSSHEVDRTPTGEQDGH